MTPRLGLTPHDPARLAAAPLIFEHARDVSGPPDKLDRSGVALHPSMGDNFWAPDCTGESAREYASAVALLAGYQLAVQPGASLKFYCGGVNLELASYPPDDAAKAQIAATDGMDMLTAAQRLTTVGLDEGPNNHRALWGKAPTDDIETMANGAAKFGMLWIGGKIYERDQDTLYSYGVWDDDGETDNGTLAGLHAFCSGWGYSGLDPTSQTMTDTWGMKKPNTWRWLMRRATIMLCLRFPQLDPAGSSLLDEQALTAALIRWAA